MDSDSSDNFVQSSSPGKWYYAGFAVFIVASAALAVWAFAMLALAK
jgi:hypothetical protein